MISMADIHALDRIMRDAAEALKREKAQKLILIRMLLKEKKEVEALKAFIGKVQS